MTIKTNSLVLYKNKGAIVVEITNDKYLIRLPDGDKKSVRLKDIEFLYPGPCTAVPQPAPEPDDAALQETAELIGSDPVSFSEFIELLFSAYKPENALAAFNILQSNRFFHGSIAEGASANSPEHIACILDKEKQKASAQEARNALLERIRSGSVIEEDRSALREIENVAWGITASSKLMHDLNMAPEPAKAQQLLLKLGIWNYFDNNPWPQRYDISLEPEHPELTDAIPTEERLDLTHLKAYAIDDADSNDPDDAISFDTERNILWVHIADPTAVITADSALEEAAREAGSTLYLPEKIVHMLPENAVPLFGLGLQEISPALSFALQITDDGNVELLKYTPSLVKVQRLNYSTGGELLDTPEFAPCVEALQRFRDMRRQNNAVLIKLPEVKVKVDIPQQTIAITPLDQNPVRELVANAMLATGHAVAKFAAANDIPLPFAIQEDPEMSERPDTIPGMYALRKSCRQSTLSTLPGKHAGLGLEPYARVTSPLRRYEDLLAHIQLRKYLAGEELLTISELDLRLAVSEPAAILRSKLERQCREYWTLVMLQNSPEPWRGEAIYAAKPDDRSFWLIPELAFEFKNHYNARIPLGEKVMVECIASAPELLEYQFRIVKNAPTEAAEESVI